MKATKLLIAALMLLPILPTLHANDRLVVLHGTNTDKDGNLSVEEMVAAGQVAPPAAAEPSAVAISQPTASANPVPATTDLTALSELTEAPATMEAKGFQAAGVVKPIFFDSLDWRGRPTKVFAWIGIPADASETKKVPGVVLVHGGGGTAFKEWVERWNKKGFAAISIAVEGQTDEKVGKVEGATVTGWKRHEWAGPERKEIYGDSDEPLNDQWMYHAVADTILANSLLRAQPGVDADKVGLMGVSWGGVITATVLGLDDRLAFAIPVYGCGGLAAAPNQYGRALKNNRVYAKTWDPMLRMGKARMPTLWFSWPGDQHFPLDILAANYREVAGPYMVTLVPGMRHGHGPAWNRPESYAFAESIIKNGKPWCVQTHAERDGSHFTATFSSTKPLESATLISTTDEGATGNRTWREVPAELSQEGKEWKVTSSLPPGTTAWFINVKTGGLIASSDFHQNHP